MPSDGCSGGISWIYGKVLKRDVPFLYCCDEHDLAYDEGGDWRDRALADRRFRECVKDGGRPARAWIFWVCVRLAGWMFWTNTIQWRAAAATTTRRDGQNPAPR